MKKKILALILSVLMLVGMIPFTAIGSYAAPTEQQGLSFEGADQWKMKKKLSDVPDTLMVWMYMGKDVGNGRLGELLTNYDGGAEDLAIDIRNNGNPYIWYYNSSGKNVKAQFKNVDIRQDKYIQLVLVIDAEGGELRCYVDGEKKQTITAEDLGMDFYYNSEAMLRSLFSVGDDYRASSTTIFKGKIAELAAYSEPMNDAQVSALFANGVDDTAADLLVHYDTAKVSGTEIKDLSGNGYNLYSAAFQNEGMNFPQGKSDIMWKMPYALTTAPLTFETWINMPTNAGDGRLGSIFSSYIGSGNDGICFDIVNNGQPRIYYVNAEGQQINHKFDKIDVRTGEYIHLVLVNDPVNDTLTCYVNGEAAQTISIVSDYNLEKALKHPFSLGGDNRTSSDGTSFNQYPFKGKMKSFAIYSTTLSAEDIEKSYINGIDTSRSDIIASYDLKSQPTGYTIPLLKGSNRNNYLGRFASDGVPAASDRPTDYAYSFAVVGDTQYMVEDDVADGTNDTGKMYDWIVANKESKKIKYVFGLGDITDNYTNAADWEHATAAISKLNGQIPYYLVRGNHDSSAPFNSYLGTAEYKAQFTDPDITDQSKCFYEEGKIDNAYTKFTIGKTKYLVMLLDYGANDDVLEWAGDIIAANPDYRVIVNTHSYLSSSGSWIEREQYSPDPTGNTDNNNGVEMWQKLISKYENIALVLCGHDPYYPGNNIYMLQSEGDNGNIVTQLLIDPQSLDGKTDANYGMVAMLYFNEDGSKVSVEYISTVKSTEDSDYLYNASVNSFDFEIATSETVNGIVKIELVGTEGLVDTYRIYFTDGSYFDYTVTNGADGAAGAAGANGTTPHIGENGNWFIGDTDTGVKAEGTDGAAGAAGANGTTPHIGENGNWFIGDTDTGVKAEGTDGAAGAAGANGTTPHIGENGNWFIGDTDTGVKAEGKDGAAGAAGANGTTPHIGENGNWFIGDTDTGVKAEGKDGADGADGKDGEDGYTPYIGVNGNWIVNGIDTGIPAKGEKGDTGATGAVGATGADGAQGEKGDKGDKGDTGATGATGVAGPQGASGDTSTVVALGVTSAVCATGCVGMAAVCVIFAKKKKIL